MDACVRQPVRAILTPMLVMISLSGILQLVGLVTPGWVIFNASVISGQIGLFYAKICFSSMCTTKTYEEFEKATGTEMTDSIDEFRAETILGVIFCAITFVFLIVSKRSAETARIRIYLTVSCITATLSAILALVASGKFANNTIRANNQWRSVSDLPSPFKAPYSVILTMIGGIFAGICDLVMMSRLCARQADDIPPSYSVPLSQANQPIANPMHVPQASHPAAYSVHVPQASHSTAYSVNVPQANHPTVYPVHVPQANHPTTYSVHVPQTNYPTAYSIPVPQANQPTGYSVYVPQFNQKTA